MATLKRSDDKLEELEDALRLAQALRRARALGWRTITVDRLVRVFNGDPKAMPPDPATAPRSTRGTHHA